MADPSVSPETANVADIAGFLRRFAELMSNGYNAAYLHRAADFLEVLTTRVVAASDEEDLARQKYETLSQHADALEAECDALKRDIEGHVYTASTILTERDKLNVALQSRESDISELRGALTRKGEELAIALQAREAALTRLQAAFDGERETLKTMVQARAAEIEQVRHAFESEREGHVATLRAREAELSELRQAFDRERDELRSQLKAGADELAVVRVMSQAESDTLKEKIAALESEREGHATTLRAREAELSELRLAFDRERDELRSQMKAGADELAVVRVMSQAESDTLKDKIAALEAKRAELRAAFDRINDLHNQAIAAGAAAVPVAETPRLAAEASPPPAQPVDRNPVIGEADAVVPKTTLLQARAQFQYLAKEFIPLGDIASQVMCELGAYTMDLALTAGQPTKHEPVDGVALDLLSSSSSVPLRPGVNPPSPA